MEAQVKGGQRGSADSHAVQKFSGRRMQTKNERLFLLGSHESTPSHEGWISFLRFSEDVVIWYST